MKAILAMIAACCVAACVAPPTPPAPPAAPQPPAVPQPPKPAQRVSAPPGPWTIVNPGLEMDPRPGARCATGWGCVVHNTPNAFRFFPSEIATEGKASFCMEPAGKEPWAMITQTTVDPALRGMRMRFSVAMRLTDVRGQGAGATVQVRRTGTSASSAARSLAQGTKDWERSTVEFDVPEDLRMIVFGMVLRGTGRACFDDARLEVLRPVKNAV